jgi:hypothetical protein
MLLAKGISAQTINKIDFNQTEKNVVPPLISNPSGKLNRASKSSGTALRPT